MSRPNPPTATPISIELGDWPGGSLSGFECVFPDAPDGGIDLVLPIQCAEHVRSWYWCLNDAVLWCDGGPPEWEPHTLTGAVSQ